MEKLLKTFLNKFKENKKMKEQVIELLEELNEFVENIIDTLED